MQNSVLPQLSQLYTNGYTDNVPDLPMQMGSRLIANDSSFYVDSNLYPSQDQLDGVFALCSQVPMNYQSGASSVMSIKRFNHPSFEDTEVACNSIHVNYDSKEQLHLSQLEVDNLNLPGRINQYGMRNNTRKRAIENVNVFQQRNPEMIVEDKSCESNWPANKKMSFCFQGQHKDNFVGKDFNKEVPKDKGPARRSQKLADRITALQKLVSPYGKTDTASVLQEASIFIKTIQVQIENMLRTLNSPLDDENYQQAIGERQYNLRNKGLCLVPLSRTQNLVMEDTMYHYSPLIDSSMPPDNLPTFM